jgi:putative FmdB family regulatory protein
VPIYVYRCDGCGTVTERRQGFGDAPLTTCDGCGGALRRVLQPVGVIFKGSGFYATDYGRSNGSASSADASSANGSASDSGSKETTAAKKD